MSTSAYQHGFSQMHPIMYDIAGREQKALKMVAVLSDYLRDRLPASHVLDIGSSTGIMTHLVSPHVKKITGIDIDAPAIQHAQQHYSSSRESYDVQDAMATKFPSASFDVVLCAHIYEHVPDATRMMKEIYRLLKPGGVCYFAAGNRFIVIEGHYHLPFLAAMPKSWSNIYLRLFGRGNYYYENHLSLRNLKKLVAQFKVIDYTSRVIADPVQFHATELVQPGSLKQKISLFLLRRAYWLSPTYIWLLRRPSDEAPA